MEVQFGTQIRKMRKAFGLTQAEFAEKSGISMMSLRRYETNERQPTMATITRMAGALGLEVGEFLWNDPESKRPYFWSADLEIKLKQVGYSTGWEEDDCFLWINYPDGELEVSEEDLWNLHESTNSFLKFKLEELKQKNIDHFHHQKR
ncbi:MAG TPA: helix-turn-helix transcriptional regulator [Candidatus Agathobaculum intestinipullorum]|nr:helix-turn-helix transcriptional regulator [Candidatus Agathobaculum intestinipullorum]